MRFGRRCLWVAALIVATIWYQQHKGPPLSPLDPEVALLQQEPLGAVGSDCNPRVPPAGDLRPLRWLFLQTKEDEESRGDPFFTVLHEGALQSDLVKESVHWGPGFPMYRDSDGLRENVKRRFGDAEHFDIVFFCGDRKGLAQQLVLAYADSRVVVATRKHECRPHENCGEILNSSKVDISMNVNPFEVAMNHDLNELSENMLLGHVFSPALRSRNYGVVSRQRSVDATLMGAVTEPYPLRLKWSQLAQQGLPRHKIKQHERPSTHLNRKNNRESWMQHFNSYASKLRKTKIFLTDAAWVFYSVQKYSEAPTAGAMVVADIPHDRMREFRHGAVEVSIRMDVAQLSSTLEWWLDRPKELAAKALVGQDWALHHVQTEQFFEQATELYYNRVAEEYGGQGMVGRVFPSPFYIRCRGAGGELWCNRTQVNKRPHYLSGTDVDVGIVPRHPAFGGPVPTVARPSGCSETGTIAPHAYKARWGVGEIALRVLLLQPRHQARASTDSLYRRLAATVAAGYRYTQPLMHWGPGWEGYDDSRSLLENIEARHDDPDFFDLILTDAGTLAAETAVYNTRRSVVVVRRDSCVAGMDTDGGTETSSTCAEVVAAHRPAIVLLGNPFEVLYNQELTALSTQALLVHTPRTTSSELVGATLPRSIDVLLVSRPDDSSVYPLQSRWREVAQGLRAAGHTIAQIDGASHETLKTLRKAKIVLTETGSRRYMPPEWEDALGSGCLVMADMPAERMREFKRFSVEVRRNSSVAELLQQVKQWLVDTSGREEKTAAGSSWAALNASPAHYLDDLIESYWEVVAPPFGEGLVGKKFPWSFQASCRSHGGEAWCAPPGGRANKPIRPHWVV